MFKLRDYQQDAINKTHEALANGNSRVIVNAPVSFGKSAVGCQLAIDLSKHGKVIISLSLSELIDQFIETMKLMGHDDYTVLKAGHKISYDDSKTIIIAMDNTLHSRQNTLQIQAHAIVSDEFHIRSEADRFKSIVTLSNAKVVIGLTGTPFSASGRALGNAITIDTKDIQSLTNDGYLSKLDYLIPAWTLDVKLSKKVSAEFTSEEISEQLTDKFKDRVIDNFLNNEYFNGSKVKSVWFTNNVKHCNDYAEKLQARGVDAFAYHGNLPKDYRERLMHAYRTNTPLELDREIHLFNYTEEVEKITPKALVSVATLNVGFSVDDIEVGVKTSSSSSISKSYQQDGRMVRKDDSIPLKYMLDFGTNVLRNGSIYDRFTPASPTAEPKEIREALAKVSLPHYELVAIDKDKIYKLDREEYDNKIEAIRNDSRRLSVLTIDELLDRLIVIEDWEEMFFTGIALCEKALSEPMEDQWGKPSTGYLAEGFDPQTQSITYKPVVGFYNGGSIEWMMELYYPLFKLDGINYVQTVKSIKTRLRSIIRSKKSIYSIRFFAEFLMTKYLDDKFEDKYFVKVKGVPTIVDRLQEDDLMVESKDYAIMYLQKQDDRMLIVTEREPKEIDHPWSDFDVADDVMKDDGSDVMTMRIEDIDEDDLPF